MYEWLAEEIREVGTERYFVVDGPPTGKLRDAILTEGLGLPESYKKFLLEFGNAKLYRQKVGYAIGVKGVPTRAETPAGEELLCVGHYLDRQAFFRLSTVGEGREVAVFESGASGLVEVSSSFGEWLALRGAAIRKRLGKRQWAKIVSGPRPFSVEEKALISARRKFEWRQIGIAPNGDVRIAVTNGSDLRLPFFSIGVRDKEGSFNGIVWLPTGDLPPAATRIFEKECYKKNIPRDRIELFSMPDPGPEDRESYWEFSR